MKLADIFFTIFFITAFFFFQFCCFTVNLAFLAVGHTSLTFYYFRSLNLAKDAYLSIKKFIRHLGFLANSMLLTILIFSNELRIAFWVLIFSYNRELDKAQMVLHQSPWRFQWFIEVTNYQIKKETVIKENLNC